jgi:hypothetical protein
MNCEVLGETRMRKDGTKYSDRRETNNPDANYSDTSVGKFHVELRAGVERAHA